MNRYLLGTKSKSSNPDHGTLYSYLALKLRVQIPVYSYLALQLRVQIPDWVAQNRFKIGWRSISIRQSDENRSMRTLKEIWSDFNWSINLVNILMFTCTLIKSVFVILFVFYFPHCSVSAFTTFQKNTKKTNNIWYVFVNKYSVVLK